MRDLSSPLQTPSKTANSSLGNSQRNSVFSLRAEWRDNIVSFSAMGVFAMNEWAWGQFALLFWAAAALFAEGARQKKIAFNLKTWAEIAMAAVIVVLLFALLSEGRGCSRALDAACVGEATC